MFPQDAAAGVISGDGLLLMADALQPSEQAKSGHQQASVGAASSVSSSSAGDSGVGASVQEDGDSDALRQQQPAIRVAHMVRLARFPVYVKHETYFLFYQWMVPTGQALQAVQVCTGITGVIRVSVPQDVHCFLVSLQALQSLYF